MRSVLFGIVISLMGCRRDFQVPPGDPKHGIPMDYEIADTHNECDGLGNGCVLVTDVVKR